MFSKVDYFRRLAEDIQKTKKGERIVIASTCFSPEEAGVREITEALIAAAKRGVHTTLIMDAFDFLVKGDTKVPGPLWFRTNFEARMREPFHTRYAALQKLEQAGGHFTITNQPGKAFSVPFVGRSHLKGVVINDIVYVGGCNLNSPHEIDIMVRFRDDRTAHWLYDLLTKIGADGNVRASMGGQDQTFAVDEKTQIIVDAGVTKQSTIFDEALAMIDNAREWLVFTSQYFAPGAGTQALARALKRGVKITYYYSHYSMHGPFEGPLHGAAQWREKRRLPASLFEHRLPRGVHLHAKLLATEQGLMVGSHNYAYLGVQLGTAEIALKRNDAAFARRAAAFIEKQLDV